MRSLVLLVALSGCFSPRFSDGLACGPGNTCPEGDGCLQGVCVTFGCSDVRDGEPCVESNIADGRCLASTCVPHGCGDNVFDPAATPPEICDDGNNVSGDGCSANCQSTEECGNGILDLGEQCDPLAPGAPVDQCRADCTARLCGDGFVDPENHEVCDNGAANADTADAACRTNCQPRRCGDGVTDSDELCDDGNVVAGDGCSGDCLSLEICGNGYVDSQVANPEQCDSGIAGGTATCRADCTVPTCGDGVVDPANGESCDDAGANSILPNAHCRPNCQLARCGDGIFDDQVEICEDGNVVSGDGCSGDCRSDETCGNGYLDLQIANPEDCDDGPLSRDGCSSACKREQPTWKLEFTGPISTRFFVGLAYDADRGCLVTFGGIGSNGRNVPPETWELCGDTWQLRTPPASPPERAQGQMAYDAARKRIVLFGGQGGPTNAVLGDTWTWDGTTWIDVSPANGPAPRTNHTLAYDAARERVVLVGGTGAAHFDETWTWDGATWTQEHPAATPGRRNVGAASYDAARARVVLFGGVQISATGAGTEANDTWEWDGTTWTEIVTPHRPSPRRTNIAYDAARRRVLLFGGNGTESKTDTWEFDGSDWVERGPLVFPSFRSGSGMAYDAHRRSTILFGGTSSTATFAETWRFAFVDGSDAIESCTSAVDSDGDGEVGCADPDCWGRCTPMCPPVAACDPAAPRCGDGVCSTPREDAAICAGDCP